MPYYARKKVTDAEIAADYECTRSSMKTAANLNVGQSTVLRALAKLGVERDGLAAYRQGAVKFSGQEAAIRARYEAGATMKRLAEEFGYATHSSFKSAIKRAGGNIRPNPIPPLTEAEIDEIKRLAATGLGYRLISAKIGRSDQVVRRCMAKHGLLKPIRTKENHPFWKGGRQITSGGYVRIKLDPSDPYFLMADHRGYALEHRIVMAKLLGRPLKPRETVHHIDGNCGHNDIGNLQLRQGKHGKGVVLCCHDCGSHNIGPVPIGARGSAMGSIISKAVVGAVAKTT